MHYTAIRLRLAVLGLSALLVAGCGGNSDGGGAAAERQRSAPAIEVVATTTQIGDLVSNVGGDRVGVTEILDAGTDPHGFEPRFSDVSSVSEAELVFVNGGDLDHWAESLVADSGSEAVVVDLSVGLPALIDDHGHADRDHDHTDDGDRSGNGGHDRDAEHDPHWWHNPTNAAAAVITIAESLSEADRDGERGYRARARRYAAEIEAMGTSIAACIDRIPPGDRNLITDHEAFGYLADRFDLNVVGTVIPALTTEAQASARDVSSLTETVERLGIKAIFPEETVSPGIAEAIADQTGATADQTLYGDTLGAEGSGAETYLGMMAANADAITAGLSGGELGCEILSE